MLSVRLRKGAEGEVVLTTLSDRILFFESVINKSLESIERIGPEQKLTVDEEGRRSGDPVAHPIKD